MSSPATSVAAACFAASLVIACGPAPGPAAPQPTPVQAVAPAPPLKLFKRFGSNDFRHGESIRRTVLLGDGGPIASVAADAVRVWDLAGHPLASIPGPAADIAALPGGTLVVAQGKALVAYKVESGEAKVVWRSDLAAEVVPYGLEARGSSLHVAVRDRVLSFDPATGRSLSRSAVLPWLSDAVGVALSPDGKTIVVRHPGGTNRYSVEQPGAEPLLLGDGVWGFVVSPDGKTALGVTRFDKTGIVAWDLASGAARWSVDTGSVHPVAIGVSADGSRLAAVSEADGIAVRDARTGAQIPPLAPSPDADFDPNEPSVAGFAPDGRHLAWGVYRDVRLWDVTRGSEIVPTEASARACTGLSSDGARTVRGGEVWDIDRDAPVLDLRTRMKSEYGPYILPSFGPSPSTLCAATVDTLHFWNLDERTSKSVTPEYWIGGNMACAARTAMLVELSGGMAGVYGAKSGDSVARIDRGGIYSSSDDSYFPSPAATADRFALPLREAVEIFDADTGASLFELPTPGGSRGVALSRDDRWLAAARPGGVEIWDLEKRSLAQSIAVPSPTSVAFVPGGAWLAYGLTDGTVGLWDIGGRARVTETRAHHGSVRDLTAGGKRLVSSGTDGICVVWEVGAPAPP